MSFAPLPDLVVPLFRGLVNSIGSNPDICVTALECILMLVGFAKVCRELSGESWRVECERFLGQVCSVGGSHKPIWHGSLIPKGTGKLGFVTKQPVSDDTQLYNSQKIKCWTVCHSVSNLHFFFISIFNTELLTVVSVMANTYLLSTH